MAAPVQVALRRVACPLGSHVKWNFWEMMLAFVKYVFTEEQMPLMVFELLAPVRLMSLKMPAQLSGSRMLLVSDRAG